MDRVHLFLGRRKGQSEWGYRYREPVIKENGWWLGTVSRGNGGVQGVIEARKQ